MAYILFYLYISMVYSHVAFFCLHYVFG